MEQLAKKTTIKGTDDENTNPRQEEERIYLEFLPALDKTNCDMLQRKVTQDNAERKTTVRGNCEKSNVNASYVNIEIHYK